MEALRAVSSNNLPRPPKRASVPAQAPEPSKRGPPPPGPGALTALPQVVMRQIVAYLSTSDVASLMGCSRSLRARVCRGISRIDLSEAATASDTVMSSFLSAALPYASHFRATLADGLAAKRLAEVCMVHEPALRLQSLDLTLPSSRKILASGLQGRHPPTGAVSATTSAAGPFESPKPCSPRCSISNTGRVTPVTAAAATSCKIVAAQGVEPAIGGATHAMSPLTPCWARPGDVPHTPAGLISDVLSRCPALRSLRLCGVQPVDTDHLASAPILSPTRLRVLRAVAGRSQGEAAYSEVTRCSAALAAAPGSGDDAGDDDGNGAAAESLPTTSMLARGLHRALGQPLATADEQGEGGTLLQHLAGAPRLRRLCLERCRLGSSGAGLLALLMQPTGVEPDWLPWPVPLASERRAEPQPWAPGTQLRSLAQAPPLPSPGNTSSASPATPQRAGDAATTAAATPVHEYCSSSASSSSWPRLSSPQLRPPFLHALRELRLRSCGLAGTSVPLLPPSVRLEILDLSWNCLGPLGSERLAATLSMQAGLRELYLEDCGMFSAHVVLALLPVIMRGASAIHFARNTRICQPAGATASGSADSVADVATASSGSPSRPRRMSTSIPGHALCAVTTPPAFADALRLGRTDVLAQRRELTDMARGVKWAAGVAAAVTDEQVCLLGRVRACMEDGVALAASASEQMPGGAAMEPRPVDCMGLFGDLFGRRLSATGDPLRIGTSAPESPSTAPRASAADAGPESRTPTASLPGDANGLRQWLAGLPVVFQSIARRAVACSLPASPWQPVSPRICTPCLLETARSCFRPEDRVVRELGCAQLEVLELGGNHCSHTSAMALLCVLVACPSLRRMGVDEPAARKTIQMILARCWGDEALRRVCLIPLRR